MSAHHPSIKARGPAVIKRRPRIGADDVRAFYKRFPAKPRAPLPKLNGPYTLTNVTTGIGDTVVLLDAVAGGQNSAKPIYAWSPSPHWEALRGFAPAVPVTHPPVYVSLAESVAMWDLGAGHITQRGRRLLGLPVPACPGGWLSVPGVRRIPGRVSMHFEAGAHSEWQRANIHPRARQVYPQTWKALREFVNARSDLSFVEVGRTRYMAVDEVENGTNRTIVETIRIMAECEYHIGVVSGPMHLAAALGQRVIALLNFPRPCQLMLPNLRSIGMVEEEWLYPHQVCLHQEEDSAHWPKLGPRTLSESIDGEVYPYWSTKVAEALHHG